METTVQTVAAQVRNGESVMLDTGSTTTYVAGALTDQPDLLVVTNCAEDGAVLEAATAASEQLAKAGVTVLFAT